MLKKYCKTSSETMDFFVGMRFIDGEPEVVFPHGYHLSDEDRECRKDIFRLLIVLQKFTERKEGDTSGDTKDIITSLPISSYQYLIQDFLTHGYYTENEIMYTSSQRGKINWKRTIQQEKAQIDNENAVYLNFQIKISHINRNNLISEIHKYCVYICFLRFGWLYFDYNYIPDKPEISFNKKRFLAVLIEALNNTYNDQKRRLFQSMINIIKDCDDGIRIKDKAVGVNRFDPIWERLIDFVFGEDDKKKYFPHAAWHIIKNGKVEQSSALEPDTIMQYAGKIYVLDAKYYKYGLTGWSNDLPATSSIQKQITYGKHIAEQFDDINSDKIYNAFVMPYDSNGGETIKFVSVGTVDWEKYSLTTKNYAYVLGILLDTKHLVNEYAKHNQPEIERLAETIETSLQYYRNMAE